MALEFLTKKKWNPSNVKNREQVWLREQALEKEKKKVAELQKQLQEERRRNELKKLQDGDSAEDSISRRRVDWIYEMPVNDDKKNEDYLTGKAVYDLYKNEKNSQRDLEDKKIAGSTFIDDDDISNPNEIRRRVNEDPLMLIRKKEMELTRNRLSNPQRIMKLAAMLKAKGSDIRLDFNDMKTTDTYDGGRATLHKGIQKDESESEGDSSDSESSDNYTATLKRKTADKPMLVKRRRSSSRSSSHDYHRRHRSHDRHHHHSSRSGRSRSRSRSRDHRRHSRSPPRHRHHRDTRDTRSRSRSPRAGRRAGREESSLTKEQVMERLRQMQQDAVDEEGERKRRLEEEERRKEQEQQEGKKAPVFLAKMNRDAYSEDAMSFSQRVSSRRNFQMKHVD